MALEKQVKAGLPASKARMTPLRRVSVMMVVLCEWEKGSAAYSGAFQYMKPMPSPVPAAVRQQGT